MPQKKEVSNLYHAKDRRDWRRWLAKHHATAAEIWVIIDKKGSRQTRLTYVEAVEEALCFGWIDSRPNKLNATQFKLHFSPRRPKSIWSKINNSAWPI